MDKKDLRTIWTSVLLLEGQGQRRPDEKGNTPHSMYCDLVRKTASQLKELYCRLSTQAGKERKKLKTDKMKRTRTHVCWKCEYHTDFFYEEREIREHLEKCHLMSEKSIKTYLKDWDYE
jgi:hypothetical protein